MKKGDFSERIVLARKKLGLSQQEVCEVICIGDPSTLSKWENGVVVPSDEMVLRLMDAYNDPIIGYIYLQECNKIGNQLLPPILLSDLDNLALNFQYEFEDIKELRRDVLEIARDGVVDANEEPRWEHIQKKNLGLLRTLIPMIFGNFYEDRKALRDGNLARAHA